MHAASMSWACAGRLGVGTSGRGLHATPAGLRLPWITTMPPWHAPKYVSLHTKFHARHSPPQVLHRGFGSAWSGDDRGTRHARGLGALCACVRSVASSAGRCAEYA